MPKKKVIKKELPKGRPIGSTSKVKLNEIGDKLEALSTLIQASVLTRDTPDNSELHATVNWCKSTINELGKASNSLSTLVTDLINRLRILENKMAQIDFSVEEKETNAIKDSQVVKQSNKTKDKNESKSSSRRKKSSKQIDKEDEPDFFAD